MLRRLDLRVGTLLLSVTVTALLLGTVAFGWLTYRELRGLILDGFDAKLAAVSATSAAFIDGTGHEQLLLERQLSGLALAPGGEHLMGIEDQTGTLLRVDLEGGATPLETLTRGDLVGLATHEDSLITWDGSTGSLWRFSTETGGWSEGPVVQGVLLDLALSPGGEILYAASADGLIAMDPGTGAVLASAEGPARDGVVGVATHPDGTVFAMAADGFTLLRYSPELEQGTEVRLVEWEEEDEYTPALAPLGALTYDPASSLLYAVGDRLVDVEPETALARGGHRASGFRGGLNPDYLRYVQPMRNIRARKDLTYLYSQLLFPDGHILYVLDGTETEDYTPPGTEDQLPEADIAGAEQVLQTGTIYLSEIQQWEEWGLLKTAFAPILGPTGRPVAMTGADVNISVISTKMRSALARVGLVGTLILLVGGLMTLRITRGLVTHLAELRDGALRIAAGDPEHRLGTQPIRELDHLATSFNEMSRSLQASVAKLNTEAKLVDSLRLRRRLRLALEKQGNGTGEDTALRTGRWALAWLAPPGGATVPALGARREVERLLRRLEGAPPTLPADAIFHAWHRMGIGTGVVLDVESHTVHLLGAGDVALTGTDQEGAPWAASASAGEKIDVKALASLSVSPLSPPAPRSATDSPPQIHFDLSSPTGRGTS